eukprot:m.271047 g.271047  ORF g.271047 m.271047 type:complete len:354 (+) comp93304_c0_seq1:109-1170(+)
MSSTQAASNFVVPVVTFVVGLMLGISLQTLSPAQSDFKETVVVDLPEVWHEQHQPLHREDRSSIASGGDDVNINHKQTLDTAVVHTNQRNDKQDKLDVDDVTENIAIIEAKQEACCLARSTAPTSRNSKTFTTRAVFDFAVEQFIRGGGDELFQHSHDYLDETSTVVEIGGNKGVFVAKLLSRYKLKAMHVIEPVTPMVVKLKQRFANNPEVHIHQFALAKTEGNIRMAYRSMNDAAAKFLQPNETLDRGWQEATIETVPMKTFHTALEDMGVSDITLMNVNIEGVEYELLDALLTSGTHTRIRNIQVQFHVHAGIDVDDRPMKRCRMRKILSRTHELVYNFDWVWEQWSLKT